MIKMIAGACSFKENGIIKLKTVHDGPFSLPAEQEERLVERGVAVYVGDPVTDIPPDCVGIPQYHADMKAEELRAIAKLMGLSFKAGTSKVDMVAAMDTYMDEHMNEDVDDSITEEQIEAPPSFDPAEAVK